MIYGFQYTLYSLLSSYVGVIDAYGFVLYMVNGMSDTDLLPEGAPLIKVKYYSIIFLNRFWYLKNVYRVIFNILTVNNVRLLVERYR